MSHSTRGAAERAGGHRRGPVAVVLLTIVGAIVPGVGLIAAGRVRSGITVLVGAVAVVSALVLYIGTDLNAVLSRAFDGNTLRRGAVVAVAIAIAWSAVTVVSHRALRPHSAGPGERVGGSLLVGVLCLGICAPLVLGANVLLTTRQVLNNIGDKTTSALPGVATFGAPQITRPTAVAPGSPTPSATASTPTGYQWSKRRINILLLGSDAAGDRTGTRTDSMVIASIDTLTGNVLLVSIPRNLERLEWEPGTKLGDAFPDGWNGTGGDAIINAIYNDVPIEYPHLLKTDNEGADALALGLSYSLGLPVDYYLLVDLDAFSSIVDAVGGVTVNINTPIPVGGQHDTLTGQTITAYPSRWIMPGPSQHLDGRNALWFSRGRFYSDDYDRINRQKCMINAIVRQTSPTKIIRSYAGLASTLENNVLTDIPTRLLSPLTQLGLKVKDTGAISSITVDPQNIPDMGSDFSNPDWDAVRIAMREAIVRTDKPRNRAAKTPSATATPNSSAPVTLPAPGASPSETATPTNSATATTSSGADVITNVGAGCTYDAAAAAANIKTWEAQYGGMYDTTTGQKRS